MAIVVNKLQLQVMANNGFDVDSGSNIKETTLLYDDQELNAQSHILLPGPQFRCITISGLTSTFGFLPALHGRQHDNQDKGHSQLQ